MPTLLLLAALLLSADDRTLEEWEAALAGPEGATAQAELVALGDDGARTAAELVEKAGDAGAWRATRALVALGTDGTKATAGLSDLLEDAEASAERRALAALALGAQGRRGGKAVGPLFEVLGSEDPPARVAAAAQLALAHLGAASVKRVAKLLDDPALERQLWSGGVLLALGEDAKSARKRCIGLLDDDDAKAYYLIPTLIEILGATGGTSGRKEAKVLEALFEREARRPGFWLMPPKYTEDRAELLKFVYMGGPAGMNGPPVLDRKPKIEELTLPEYEDFNGDGRHSYAEWMQVVGVHLARQVAPLAGTFYATPAAEDAAAWEAEFGPYATTWHLVLQLLPNRVKEGRR